ncbi:MAG: efflux transporter outer membrane subunit [Legionella sp.]|nr:efflux transporter outer membrane subunit [Legionella sp.]
MIKSINKQQSAYAPRLVRGVSCILIILLCLSACGSKRDIIDLSPKYEPEQLIIPKDWRGQSPFKLATPADNSYNGEWWKIFHDSILNQLQEKFHESNPTLQAAAERFIQSRYEMMKARSMYLPHIGITGFYDNNQRSADELEHGEIHELARGNTGSFMGPLSWEPDIFSRYRNLTNVRVFQAQSSAAHYGAIRLLLQTELTANYFVLRTLDAKNTVYKKSIRYFKRSLDIVTIQFEGNLASRLDVARAKYLLKNTEAKQLAVEADRQVTEQSIAALLNISPSVFKIKPAGGFTVPKVIIPDVLPAKLLERRPDIADLERKMAQANKNIGIARAAFFPQINLNGSASVFLISQISNPVWALGSILDFYAFKAGYRRAQLQKSWSQYRETVNQYREGVLKAFKEVEHGLSKTNLMTKELGRQKEAVSAAVETQDLTMDLFTGKLASSLDLLYAEIYALEARIREVEVKQDLMVATVYLVKALGGGWNMGQIPQDEQIPAFKLFQYDKLGRIEPVVGIAKSDPKNQSNLMLDH